MGYMEVCTIILRVEVKKRDTSQELSEVEEESEFGP